MTKYQVICKACGSVLGFSDKPIMENMPTKCSICGMERIAIEPIPEEMYTQMDFDVFVTNKRTGISKHQGATVTIDDLKNKSEEEIKSIFVERVAEALGMLLRNQENLMVLLNNGGKIE